MKRSFAMSSKSALVVFTEGAEEMETVITVDVLRRAGVEVTLASTTPAPVVKCSRGVNIVPDTTLAAVKDTQFDLVVIPGGLPNAKALAADAVVGEVLRAQEAAGRLCAALCASTIAFASHGIAKGRRVTSHPSVKDQIVASDGGYTYTSSRVEHDGQYVTSQGPGTSFEFALKLAELLVGKEKADSLKAPMVCAPGI